MKTEYVNPFISAATSVIEMVISEPPKRGSIAARPQIFTSQQINVVYGVTGPVQGQVIFGMSVQTATNIAGRMVGNPVHSFDALAASAIAELGNMISGNAMTSLSNAGFDSDITPPTIIRGSNVKISTMDIPALVIGFSLGSLGEFELTVCVRERPARAA